MSSYSNLFCALSFGDKYKKPDFKGKAIWRGILVRRVFRDCNILCAVLIMDAWLRRNKKKLVVREPLNLSGDLYCTYALKMDGVSKNLDDVFDIVRYDGDDVWGFRVDNSDFCDGVERFCRTGRQTFDVD